MENAEPVPSNGSIGRAVIKIDLAPQVSEFIQHVRAGVDSWEKAGQILVNLHNENKRVLIEINQQYPFITIDSLEIFLHIGQRSLYPLVLLLPRQVLGAVRVMRYDAQKQITTEPVVVVTRCVGDKPVITRKSVANLTAEEVKRALFSKGNRSVEWQVRHLRNETALLKAVTPLPRTLTAKEMQRVPQVVAKFAVRRGVGGKWIFEPTTANAASNQRVIVTTGHAVIEICEYPNEE